MTDISNPSRTIVVLGATGQQGGGVVRALAADGRWRIRTISRNPDSDAARSLADAAKAAGVAHFIYSSVGGADRSSGVPHFESKWRVEEYVREIGLPASIVRPAFFMENFAKPSLRMTIMGMIRAWVPKTKPLQMIAVDDIGKWVAHAFAHPETFIGKAEEIAGDELTRPEIVAAFKRHGWYPALPIPLPRLAFRPLPYDIRKMMEWFGTDGYTADIPALRARHPDLLTFDQWLSAQASARPIA
jgi:uncharacterized protein YbjT (DUF2867 family)